MKWWLANIVIGICSGVAASATCYLVYQLWGFFYVKAQAASSYIFILPLTGLTLSYYVTLTLGWFKGPKSSFHTVLELFHLAPNGVQPREVAIRGASGIITSVFGGSAGPEGPSVLFGGGISTLLYRWLHISIEPGKALLIGVAAGISAVFKTPLTGLLFALEFPYRKDLDKDIFMEAAVASSTAYLVALVLGIPSMLPELSLGEDALNMYMMPLAISFGALTGVATLLFTRLFTLCEDLSKRLVSVGGYPLMLVVGGLVLGLIGFYSPESLGSSVHLRGYLTGASLFTVATLLSFKTTATILTLTFGGCGGTFLPVIYIGALWGSIAGNLVDPSLLPIFILMGIAGFTAGVHKMMITPIIFVAESYGSDNLIPIIMVTVVTYFIAGNYRFFPIQPESRIKEEELALERFYHKIRDKPSKSLQEVKAVDIMTRSPVTLDENLTVRKALQVFTSTTYRVLPVVTTDKRVAGYVTLEDLAAQPYKLLDSPLGFSEIKKPLVVHENDAMIDVIERMIKSNDDRCFIVDSVEHLVGVISSIDVTRFIMRYYTSN